MEKLSSEKPVPVVEKAGDSCYVHPSRKLKLRCFQLLSSLPPHPITDLVPSGPCVTHLGSLSPPCLERALRDSGPRICPLTDTAHLHHILQFTSPPALASHTAAAWLQRSFETKPLPTFPVLSIAQPQTAPLPAHHTLFLLKHVVHVCAFMLWGMLFSLCGYLRPDPPSSSTFNAQLSFALSFLDSPS